MDGKVCSCCNQWKVLDDFSLSSVGKYGRHSHCHMCRRAKSKITYQTNKEQIKVDQKIRNLKYRYGIDLAQYDSLFSAQSGVCAICGRKGADGRRFDIDHNHETGKLRGLLCPRCNMAIGLFDDSSASLQNAADYLRSYGS